MLRRDFLLASAAALSAPAKRPPNVIVVFCDDLGYGDLGCYGSPLRTPHLDRMAVEGVRGLQHTSANALCSPSRAALLTGKYPTRVGIPRVLNPQDNIGLPDSEQTLAQVLKASGYQTHCIGKWHLGHHAEHLPTRKGFDTYFGIPYSNDMNPPVLLEGERVIEPEADQATLTTRYTERAVRFIEQAKDKPFFLYLPHTFPHVPLYESGRFRGKVPGGLYGAVIADLDWSMGEIFAALKRTGLDRDTLVLFSSDNGPWWEGSPGALRSRKGSTYEGGVRVPFLARMPGRIPGDRVVREVTSTLDLFPTVAKLCGTSMPDGKRDGVDLWPLLTGRSRTVTREPLLYFDGNNLQCLRDGRWKLHLARYNAAPFSAAPAGGRLNLNLPAPELYDLETDPNESYDVAPEHPEVVTRLQAYAVNAIAAFPDPVRQAWAATQARRARPGARGIWPQAQ